MFKIGEFSKIAQVSGRLLRYYDEIGLFKPQYIEPETGYRYYSADQLPRLNRILALKDLGLSLEQIQRLLKTNIGPEDIRQLYLERKAQLEQSLREELARLQQVQLRLQQLEQPVVDWIPDVVIKRVPAQPFLAYRDVHMTSERLYQLFEVFSQQLAGRAAERSGYGSLVTVLYSEVFTPEAVMDVEIGVLLSSPQVKPLTIAEGVALTVRELPAVDQMATIVHQGLDDHPLTYNGLGRWLEAQRYGIVGPGREVLVENQYPASPDKCIVEIAFPVERVDVVGFDLLELLS
jgi:DNA-binding transcriptional MerR regulator